MNKAHLSYIRYDDEFEFVSVFPKDLFEVGSLRLRPNGGSDRVTLLEEDVNDMDGSETVRSGDEDFTSWGDDWHVFLFLEVLDELKCRGMSLEIWRSGLVRELEITEGGPFIFAEILLRQHGFPDADSPM